MKEHSIEVQGHRGCRGLYPENTIEGFIHALSLGVKVIELDLVISRDSQVVVSHEAFFSHKISKLPNGKTITQEEEASHNIYQMDYAEVRKYDVGSKQHPDFIEQKKIPAYKPLLSEVIQACDSFATKNKLPLPFYNIEIKRTKALDHTFNPPARVFVKLVVGEIVKNNITDRCNIQSFDHECVNESYNQNKNIKTAILVGDVISMKEHLSRLNHKPYAYSPHYKLVTAEAVMYCNNQNIKIIPWTVNDEAAAKDMINLKVDGIITDYPELVLNLLKAKQSK